MDPALSMDVAKQVLLSLGAILAAGSICGLLAQKARVPDVVIFLLAGILLGPEMFGVIDVKADSALNQIILIFGSCYILFDGGTSLRLKVLKEVWITIVTIATVGVLIMIAVTGVAAFYILEVPFIVALLLGAAIASTDPATLVPIFKQVRIKDRVAQTVMAESAFNDAMGAIVTFAVLAVAMGNGDFSLGGSLLKLLKEASIGILAGAILGYLASLLIAHEKFDFLSEYAPVVTLMAVIGAYLVADRLQASGFMSVFVFGIFLGNRDTFGFRMEKGEEERLELFVSTTAFIMRMFIFILLGTQVNFALMNQFLGGGILVVLIFMLVGRPLTVFACASPDRCARWSFRELIFMCWTRETGVIPAALVGLLVGVKAPGSEMIASVTFIAILMTILLQATTTKWLARRLDLLVEE